MFNVDLWPPAIAISLFLFIPLDTKQKSLHSIIQNRWVEKHYVVREDVKHTNPFHIFVAKNRSRGRLANLIHKQTKNWNQIYQINFLKNIFYQFYLVFSYFLKPEYFKIIRLATVYAICSLARMFTFFSWFLLSFEVLPYRVLWVKFSCKYFHIASFG